MTVPVEDDDLLSGATKYLLSIPEILTLVGYEANLGPYIWQETPLVSIEKQATTAIVVTTSSIGIDDEAHSQHFERLGIEFWVGPIRDAMGNVIEPAETRRRLMKAYGVVDRYLHRTDPHEQRWGSVRTYSSERLGSINRYALDDGTGVVIGQAFYVVQFD